MDGIRRALAREQLIKRSSSGSIVENTKASHRPLHSHVAELLEERSTLLNEIARLSALTGQLNDDLQHTKGALDALQQRHDIAVASSHGLEEHCRELEESCRLLGEGMANSTVSNTQHRDKLADAEARCSQLLGKVMSAGAALNAERKALDECRDARTAEVAALTSERELHDAELGRRDLQIISTLGEVQWLREKLSTSLRKQHTLKQQLASHRVDQAQGHSELADKCARLESELRLARDERHALSTELVAARGEHSTLELELSTERHTCAALKQRCDDADEARVHALTYADRVDHALVNEQASAQRVAQLQDALRLHFNAAAMALEQSAAAVESMRWTHSNGERHALVQRTWTELCKRGIAFSSIVAETPPDESPAAAKARGGGSIALRSASDVALASAANAFARASLALAASASQGVGDGGVTPRRSLPFDDESKKEPSPNRSLASLAWGPVIRDEYD